MASAFFRKVGDVYVNQAGPGQIILLYVVPNSDGSGNWCIAGDLANGKSFINTVDIFTTQAAALTALATYVGNLNAGTAGP